MQSNTTDTIKDKNLHELITAIDGENDSHYPITKLQAHIDNVPHLAVSIFIFRDEKMLLQKRAPTKYHAGGLWANTVCSHPRWQESAANCAKRRLPEELGWSVPLTEIGEIGYAAPVGGLFENEHVHCFFGEFASRCNTDDFNPEEVSAVEWMSIPKILNEIDRRPETFTPWFKIYMAEHRQLINGLSVV